MDENRDELVTILKACVTYVINFHAEKGKEGWLEHLDGLLSGRESRIVPEWGYKYE